jgi:hypothetical protein
VILLLACSVTIAMLCRYRQASKQADAAIAAYASAYASALTLRKEHIDSAVRGCIIDN